MLHATMGKSAAAIVLVIFLDLGVVELISHAEAAGLPRPTSQPETKARSQVTLPEPAMLVRSYERSLAAYGRMRGRWTIQLEEPKPDKAENSEWAIFRDHGRLRLIETAHR